jgi:hypothetical protein
MPRTPRKVLLVPLLAAALLGAGCSSTVQGTPAATGASPGASDTGGGPVGQTDDPVAWVDQVCAALVTFAEGPGEPPEISPSSSPEQAIGQLTDYLGKASDTATTAIDGIRAAGPSPVAGGDEFAAQMTEVLTTVKTTFDSTREQFENLDPSDPSALLEGLGALTTPEGLEDLEDPSTALQRSPELAAAAQQAPKCQELDRI